MFARLDPELNRPAWRLTVFAAAAGGVAFCLLQIIVGLTTGLFTFPGGDAFVWDRVGDNVRAGMSPYGIQPQLSDTFFYAPPWAVGFALTSWLPVWLQALLLVVAKILSLRIIGRSWIGAGLACWFPLVAFDLVGGNFNLLVAAAIVAAIRGHPELAVVTALAKLSPILAIRPRDWKRASFAATALVLVTAPVLTLWPDWISHLIEATGLSFGASLPVPLWARAIVGGGLLLLRRPTTTALAAVLMIPAFYWGSLVVLIAPTAVLIEELRRVSLAHVASGSPQRDRRDAPPPTRRSNDLPAQPESS